MLCFFFQEEDGIRDSSVTGVQTCALPISKAPRAEFSTVGDSWFAKRGRSSRAHCARTSSRRFGRRVLVNWPTTMLVLSFSVPLFESALVVLGSRALPRLLELSALLPLLL